jgi:hypothetical protein
LLQNSTTNAALQKHVSHERNNLNDDAHHRFHRSGTMHTIWFWLVAGLLPYAMKRYQTKDEHVLRVQALFWLLVIQWQQGHSSWEVYIPLIERLRQ